MDLFTLWQKVMDRIKHEDPQYANIFYHNVFPTDFSRNRLKLMAKTPYLVDWIQNVYLSKLKNLVSEEAGMPCSVEILSSASQDEGEQKPERKEPEPASPAAVSQAEPFPKETPPMAKEKEDPVSTDQPPADILHIRPKKAEEVRLPNIQDLVKDTGEISLFDPLLKKRPEKKKEDYTSTPINEEYTFDNFVHGNCNEMAYQAALSVAKSVDDPSKRDLSLNPLFIYGESGLGKTHLLHAICNYVRLKKPEMKVIFVTSEQFTNDLIQAIQNHNMEKFRSRYRTADFLLIDDVQFFGSRDSTKMEIFNTFNDLFDRKKFIILTSDRTPDNIEKLEDRLKSRFRSGLVVQISKPDYEICCIILKRRAEKDHIALPEDVIDLVASHINENVRELEGAYNKLISFSRIEKVPITLDFARETLKEEIPFDNRHNLTVDIIIDTVCKYFGVKREKLLSVGRPKNIVIPRQIAMYLCRTELNESFPALSQAFHKKDHSTVLYACERVEKSLKKDPNTQTAVKNLREILKKI